MPAIVVIDLSAPPPPGLVPCVRCGQPVHPDRPTIHFPTAVDQRPCPASWPTPPAKKAASS